VDPGGVPLGHAPEEGPHYADGAVHADAQGEDLDHAGAGGALAHALDDGRFVSWRGGDDGQLLLPHAYLMGQRVDGSRVVGGDRGVIKLQMLLAGRDRFVHDQAVGEHPDGAE